MKTPSFFRRYAVGMFAALCGGIVVSAADTPINLLREERFLPVRMHDRDSAARGWGLDDPGRTSLRRTGKYLRGEDCFTLEFNADGMTFRFPDPLVSPYRKKGLMLALRSILTSHQPPAPEYRTTGRVRFDKGAMIFFNGPRLEPSPEWQKLDFTTKGKICHGFRFKPVAGAAYTFGALRTEAVYPAIGGEIALPDGGKLTRLLLPENAGYLQRIGVAMWRGWLWKLTGVALPIETVKELKPTPGAFVAIPGKTVPGGWELTVGKAGITLVYGEEPAIVPALFDYLRLGFGCGFYSPDCIKLPPEKVTQLAAIERKPKPKFRFITCGTPWIVCSGGWDPRMLYARNDVDYYHLPAPKWDHVLNVIMPGEIYFKDHPEYFMMNRRGERVCDTDPYRTNPCFASREGIGVMTERLMHYTDLQDVHSRITMATGDVWEHCQCPECIAFNGGRESNSDSQMLLVTEIAKAMAKRHPEKIFVHDVYATRHTVPKHVPAPPERNVLYFYCLTEVVPCTLHVDCEYNRKALEEIAGWNRYLGGRREQLGFMTYHDLRPLQHLRQMEYLNRLGCGEVYLFDNLGFPMSAHFTSARWNLGEDPDKLMEEFDLNYYGKAGPAMHKITLYVDEFARSYKHAKTDFARGHHHMGIWGAQSHYTLTALTRKEFDAIYRFFDEALAAAGGDPAIEKRIFEEMKLYMVQDIGHNNLFKCRNDAEIRAFAGRVERFFRMARKCPAAFEYISWGVDTVDLINNATGLRISKATPFWAKDKEVDRFLADPVKAFSVAPETIPGGIYYTPRAIRGGTPPRVYGYGCPRRFSTSIGRARAGTDRAEVVLTLDKAPAAPLLLAVEGLDDDKKGTSLMEVSVNGKVIFCGANPFPEKVWGRMGLTLSAEALKNGENRIALRNITPDLPSRSARFADPKRGAADTQWGWICFSEVYVLDPNGDFDRYKAGDAQQPWHLAWAGEKDPGGKVEAGGGKVVITGAPGDENGFAYFVRGHRKPKLAAQPGSKVKFAVTASGEGKLVMRLWNYLPQRGTAKAPEFSEYGYCGSTRLVKPHSSSAPMTLGAEPKTFRCELTVPSEGGLLIPRVALLGEGRAEVTDLRIEIVPPEAKRP